MKKQLFILALILTPWILFSQEWIKNLPKDKLEEGTLSFYEIQDAFNSHWEPMNVEEGYYLNRSGEKTKAPYWKQFRRWEWYWSNRVDPKTGDFPETNATVQYRKWQEKNERSGARNGNWTSVGPTTSTGGYAGLGRLNCVAFDPVDANTYYAGAASGGIWKTIDDAASWIPLGDDNEVLGVSDIIVVNSNTLYIATGDRDGGSMWSLGGGQDNDNNSVGVLKSTDGGTTWNTTGLSFDPAQQERVNRLLLDPGNDNILYAATTDGVYKTTDAGASWAKIDALAFIDMEFKPGDVSVIYGATESWSSTKIYLSTDGGNNWSQISSYSGRRTELAVSPDEPTWVYALVASGNGGLSGVYKSTNSGASYSQAHSGSPNLLGWDCSGGDSGGQGSYDLILAADPNDANTVYVGGVNSWKSTDGGNTFSIVTHWSSSWCSSVVHADKHYYAFQNGTSTLYECNDGGLYRTSDGGNNWAHLSSGMAISQIYRMGVGQLSEDEVIVGLQDNGTKSNLSNTWTDVIGGDGFECIIDPTDANTQYGSLYYGRIFRTTNGWTWDTEITNNLPGSGWWITPYAMDPSDNNTLYVGYSEIYKSTNQGNSWTTISSFGGNNLRSMAVAPSNSNYIYAATQDILYKTEDGGANWTNITASLPVSSNNITYIAVKDDDPNTVWVTFGEYNSDGIYQTTDGGASWTNISSGLPQLPVMCATQNTQNTNATELYVGTDVGVYVKQGINDWVPFNNDLPNVVVTELEIYYDDNNDANSRIYAATYGRGVWKSALMADASFITADFAADTLSGNPPLAVAFSDSSASSDAIDTWAWDFGDGNTSTDQNPVHSYQDVGVFTVALTVTGIAGSDTATKTDYIEVTYPAPTADFEGNPLSGIAPLEVSFTDLSIDTVNAWSWDFGDGNSSTDQNPLHLFTDPGTYSVKLVVTGPGGSDSLTKTDYIQVDYPEPVADFEGIPTSGLSPLTVDFTDLSADSVNTWEWNFGDGNTSSQQNPQHEYIAPGVYTVSLSVSGPGGSDTETKTDYITVEIPAPIADFEDNPTFGFYPLEVEFTDLSLGEIDQWHWEFGDGEFSSLQNPVHTYQDQGTYSVKLKVTGLGGSDSITKENYISILVGTKEINSEGLKVYPNPVDDYLMIESDKDINSIHIFSADGQRMQIEEQFSKGRTIRMNTSSFLKGIYYCRIHMQNEDIVVVRFVK